MSILSDHESPSELEKNLPSEQILKMSDFELHFHKVRLEREIYKRKNEEWINNSEQRDKEELERIKKKPFIITKREDGRWEMEAVGHMGNGTSAGYGPYDTKEQCLKMIPSSLNKYPVIIKE